MLSFLLNTDQVLLLYSLPIISVSLTMRTYFHEVTKNPQYAHVPSVGITFDPCWPHNRVGLPSNEEANTSAKGDVAPELLRYEFQEGMGTHLRLCVWSGRREDRICMHGNKLRGVKPSVQMWQSISSFRKEGDNRRSIQHRSELLDHDFVGW